MTACDLWPDSSWPDKLDAFVDGEGAPEGLAAVEEHLRSCPACAAEVLSRMRIKQATRTAAAMRFSPSPQFQLRVEKSIRKAHKPWFRTGWSSGLAAAAAVLLVAVFSAILWARHWERQQYLAELLDVHVATLASANPVDVVSTDRHTVKPWFQGRLPFTFNLPELASSPFTLLGGRVVYWQHNPGAQLLFAKGKHQFSVFLFEGVGPGIFSVGGEETSRERGFSMESWNANGLQYTVVSDAAQADVHQLAEMLKAAGNP